MGTFAASLKTLGDRSGVPAQVELADGRLSIVAGEHSIGSWGLEEISLEPTRTGFQLGAEGEHIILEMGDEVRQAFALALQARKERSRPGIRDRLRRSRDPEPEKEHTPPEYGKPMESQPPAKRRFGRAKVRELPSEAVALHREQGEVSIATPPSITATPTSTPATEAPTQSPIPDLSERRGPVESPSPVEPPAVKLKPAKPATPKPSFWPGTISRIDGFLEGAEQRWGALLPAWFFTRFMFFLVLVAFVLMLVFPGAVSAFLLGLGVLLVILGAIVYSDGMLASRWLPGRMTPIHVLIFGVMVLMLGVLLGVIAR